MSITIILRALLILSAVIFIHELGHFLTAKFFKMPVDEFSIGMGPQIFSYNTEETTYSIRGIPMGGYVKIDGMEAESEIENGFNTKPVYQRFIVLSAGVFMNFFSAILTIFIALQINGINRISEEPVIGDISPQSLAIEQLHVKDKIVEIEGKEVKVWTDITGIIQQEKKDKLNIKISRDDKIIDEIVPILKIEDRYVLGIIPEITHEKLGVLSGLKESFKTFKNIFVEMFKSLGLLVSGRVKTTEISGPIGIIKLVGEATQNGINSIMWVIVFLSINVGLINLLPFPALDGGRLIFLVFEGFGIKISKKLEEKFHTAGFITLLFIIILVSLNDVFNLFK